MLRADVTTNPGPHLFWISSRAAGSVSLVFSSLAVSLGLTMSGRLLKRSNGDLRAVHEALSIAALIALAVHAVALLGDGYLRPTVFDITVPFASSYKMLWTTLGIVSGWGLLALGLSYYWRAQIGVARWRLLHRFTALAWIGGLLLVAIPVAITRYRHTTRT